MCHIDSRWSWSPWLDSVVVEREATQERLIFDPADFENLLGPYPDPLDTELLWVAMVATPT